MTQATIGRTICRSGWTSTVRPPESITEPEKFASMRAYGAHGTASDYEYDHFVPLELGGATNDRRNLWPEPGASPNPKDAVEDELNRAVCEERMTLAQAQHAIVSNWVALVRKPAPAAPKPKPKPQPKPSPPKPSGWCSASGHYNNTYNDYDVYVESNQPDQDATVSGDGKTASYYTNSSGYADVYFYAGPSAAGVFGERRSRRRHLLDDALSRLSLGVRARHAPFAMDASVSRSGEQTSAFRLSEGDLGEADTKHPQSAAPVQYGQSSYSPAGRRASRR